VTTQGVDATIETIAISPAIAAFIAQIGGLIVLIESKRVAKVTIGEHGATGIGRGMKTEAGGRWEEREIQ